MSLHLSRYVQDINEEKRYTIDYSEWLQPGEELIAITSTVDNTTTPAFTVTDSIVANGNLGVVFFTSGGKAGEKYVVTVQVTTTLGQIKEDTILYVVEGT